MELQITDMQVLLERLNVSLEMSGSVPSRAPAASLLGAYVESINSAVEVSIRGEGSVFLIGGNSTSDTYPEDTTTTKISEPESSPEDLQVEELKIWLGSVEYRNSYTAFVQRRFADSQVWVFEQPAIKHWFWLRPGYSLLWVNGIAG